MGGDGAPRMVVQGALAAVDEDRDLQVLLVGLQERLLPFLEQAPVGAVSLVDAREVVGEEPRPAMRVRERPDASVLRTVQLVAEGRADAAVSVGNTGAVLTSAVLALGLLPGVRRPVVAGEVPCAAGTLFGDLGANSDASARHLLEFARLACAWHRVRYGDGDPSVALLSNGREPGKGTPRAREAARLLEVEGVNFKGFCEPADLVFGRYEVVLADGYIGNLVLKTMEALSTWYGARIAGIVGRGDEDTARLQDLVRDARRLSDFTMGPAITVLGVNGIVVPGHGRAEAADIARLIHRAKTAALEDDCGRLRRAWHPQVSAG